MYRFVKDSLKKKMSPRRAFRGSGRRRSAILASTVLAAFFAFGGCTPIRPPQPEDLHAVAPTRVNLAPGDVIRLTFTANPDLSQVVKLRADGTISMPQIGEVSASGKSIAQLRSELMSRYQSQLKNNDIVVTLENAVTVVYIAGAVGHPGKLAFDRPTTVLQALSEAGGINQFGNPRRVQVIRLVKGEERTQLLDLHPTLAGRTTRPYYVRDGDIISVPQSAF